MGRMEFVRKLLPADDLLAVETIEIAADSQQIVVHLKSMHKAARCPLCQTTSRRRHSQYERTLKDLPWANRAVVIRLEVSKWVCQNPGCARRIFTERLPEVVRPWARQTVRLAEGHAQLGLTVGGRTGAYLSGLLHSRVSRDTLLRLVRRQSIGEPATPRVLGIDDWAKRKGQTYGTILVDLERHQVVDVLPERSAACVEQWLKAHPGVAIISRDRAGEYAAGAKAGAPEALQVADRFHLVKTLGDTLTKALNSHSRELQSISRRAAAEEPLLPDPVVNNVGVDAAPSLETPRTVRGVMRLQKQARRRALYEQVCALHDQGWMHKTIAAQLGLSAKTVSRWLAAGHYPDRQPRAWPPGRLDPYKPYLYQRWADGCRNGAQLRREIVAQGYRGRATQVADFIAQLRRVQGLPTGSHALIAGGDPHQPVLTPRALTSILFKAVPDRTPEQARLLQVVIDQLPAVQPLLHLAQDFIQLVRQRLSASLDAWLERASGLKAFQSFVNGIRQDYAAVYAALATEYNNGQVEGQVNRLKFLKRQGYGRAKFDLLRRRVLLA